MAIKDTRAAGSNNPHAAPMTTSAGVQVPAGMEAIYADAQKSMEGFVPATKGVPENRRPNTFIEREVTEPGSVKTLYGKKAVVSIDPSVHGPLNPSEDNPRFKPGGQGLVVSTPPTTRIARYRDPHPTPMSSPQFLGFSTVFPDPTLTVNNRGEAVHVSSIYSDPDSFRWPKSEVKKNLSAVDLDTAAGSSVAQYWLDHENQSKALERLTGLRGGAPRDEQIVGMAAAQAMQTHLYNAATGKYRKADSRTVNEGIERASKALGMDRPPSNEYIDMADPSWDDEQIDIVSSEAARRVRTGLMVEDEIKELMTHGERKPSAELPGMKGVPGVPRYTAQKNVGGRAGDSSSVVNSIDKSNRLHRENVKIKEDKAKAEKKAAAEAAAKEKAEAAAAAAKKASGSKKGKKK